MSFPVKTGRNLTQGSLKENSLCHGRRMPQSDFSSMGIAQPTFSNRYLWAIVLAFLVSTADAQSTVGGLTQIVAQIKLIANVLFIGAIVWAAVRTVLAFAGGSQNAMGNALKTILIAVFWFGFNYFVEDVAGALGGSGAGEYTGR